MGASVRKLGRLTEEMLYILAPNNSLTCAG